MTSYRIEGSERLWEWVDAQADQARAQRVINWVADLTDGDFEQHQFLPDRDIPIYLGVTTDLDVMIEFSVLEGPRVVTLLKIIDAGPPT